MKNKYYIIQLGNMKHRFCSEIRFPILTFFRCWNCAISKTFEGNVSNIVRRAVIIKGIVRLCNMESKRTKIETVDLTKDKFFNDIITLSGPV